MKYVVSIVFSNEKMYLSRKNSNPYTGSVTHPDTKVWKTKSGAEKWVALRKKTAPGLSFEVEEIS